MARTVSIGSQDFEMIRREGYFYIDKTNFIREWWESGDSVTLITRPRRFGKTLNMNIPCNPCHNGTLQIGIRFKRRIKQASGKSSQFFPIPMYIGLLHGSIVFIQKNQNFLSKMFL